MKIYTTNKLVDVERLFKADFVFYSSLLTTPGVFNANEALLIQTKERKRERLARDYFVFR